MTQSSKSAYQTGKEKRASSRAKIIAALRTGNGFTFDQMARHTGLKRDECWKRLSELETDGIAQNLSNLIVNNIRYSVYTLNPQPELFRTKRLTWAQYSKKKHPESYREWEVLNKHEL